MKIKLSRKLSLMAGTLVFMALTPVQAAEETEPADSESIQTIVTEAQRMAQQWAQRIRSWKDSGDKSTTYMGVVIESVPKVLRDYIELPDGVGLLFTHIAKDSPAEKAGLMDNDIIVSFDGQLVINFNQLSTLIDLSGPGAEVPVKVLRKGKEVETTIILEERMRRDGKFISPGAVDAPAAPEVREVPDADDVGTVMEKIEEWIPGSVKVFVDENEQVHVDLQDLKEDLQDLRLKLIEIREANGNAPEIREEYGDMGARTKVIHIQDRKVDYNSPEGRVRLMPSEAGQQAEVWDENGNLIYDGPLPDDYAQTLPSKAVKLIDAYKGSRHQLQLDSDLKHLEIRLNEDEVEPLTFIHN